MDNRGKTMCFIYENSNPSAQKPAMMHRQAYSLCVKECCNAMHAVYKVYKLKTQKHVSASWAESQDYNVRALSNLYLFNAIEHFSLTLSSMFTIQRQCTGNMFQPFNNTKVGSKVIWCPVYISYNLHVWDHFYRTKFFS